MTLSFDELSAELTYEPVPGKFFERLSKPGRVPGREVVISQNLGPNPRITVLGVRVEVRWLAWMLAHKMVPKGFEVRFLKNQREKNYDFRLSNLRLVESKQSNFADRTLTAERARELFDYNESTGELSWKKNAPHLYAGKPAGHAMPSRGNRSVVMIDGKIFQASRVVYTMVYGDIPDGMNVKFRSKNVSDLKLHNLYVPGLDQDDTL